MWALLAGAKTASIGKVPEFLNGVHRPAACQVDTGGRETCRITDSVAVPGIG